MIKFIINKNDLSHEFECDTKNNISSLKKQIIDEFKLKCKYIDIDFQLERPIRSLGKFNLEKGILPRTLDDYTFDRYDLDGRTIHGTYIEVSDYNPEKYNRRIKSMNFSKYKEEKRDNNEMSFDITSDIEFPALG